MVRFDTVLSGLRWRSPWYWPSGLQHVFFLCLAILGSLPLSPWYLEHWQMWQEANQAHDNLLSQKSATQALRDQARGLLDNSAQVEFADVTVLTQLAPQHGLQVSHIRVDQPVQSPALKTLEIQQLPVQLRLSGAWTDWLSWLMQLPTSMPGVVVSSLDLHANSQDGITVQLEVDLPQSTRLSAGRHAAHSNDGVPIDPFNAQSWLQTQRTYAQQHPSYMQWVVPELLRPREPLELFPLERLQYVGQIAVEDEVEALVLVLPLAATPKVTSMTNLHRVRVGDHLGQNFGRVQRMDSVHLVLQELALMPTGEWQWREVNLPLKESGR